MGPAAGASVGLGADVERGVMAPFISTVHRSWVRVRWVRERSEVVRRVWAEGC